MSHGQVAEILDSSEDDSLHPVRLLAQDGKRSIGIRREDERVKFFGLELIRVGGLVTIFQYSTFLGSRNETRNYAVEAECNVACLLRAVLPDFIHVKELGMDEHHTVGRHWEVRADLLERIHLGDACKGAAFVIFEQSHARLLENAFLSHYVRNKATKTMVEDAPR
jgi:hypothetical protein